VSHAVSSAPAGHWPPPPLLLPLLLLPVRPHCEAQLFPAHVARAPNAVFVCSHSVQVPSVLQLSSQVTQVESLLHTVAWAQHCAARQFAHVEVAVMAGHEPPPLEDPVPELEQLPPDDVEPTPMPPPIPPPPDEPQLLLPPLEEEHPKTARAATTADAPKRPMIRFISEAPVLAR
jgi:hypothetical protein